MAINGIGGLNALGAANPIVGAQLPDVTGLDQAGLGGLAGAGTGQDMTGLIEQIIQELEQLLQEMGGGGQGAGGAQDAGGGAQGAGGAQDAGGGAQGAGGAQDAGGGAQGAQGGCGCSCGCGGGNAVGVGADGTDPLAALQGNILPAQNGA